MLNILSYTTGHSVEKLDKVQWGGRLQRSGGMASRALGCSPALLLGPSM